VQDADSNNIVQPVIIWMARLKNHPQDNPAIWLRWPRSLDENIGAVMSEHIVAGVWVEAAFQVIVTPVGAQVEERACLGVKVSLLASGSTLFECKLTSLESLDFFFVGELSRRAYYLSTWGH
jgi:hypothetical protein